MFQVETGQDRLKRREKNFLFGIVFTQPEQENSQKNSIKIQKIKKSLPSIISSRNKSGQDEKKGEKFSRSEQFLLDPS